MPLVIERRQEPAHEDEIKVLNLTQDEPWFTDIKNFPENQEYPLNSSKKEQWALRLLASQYFLNGVILFKWHYVGTYIWPKPRPIIIVYHVAISPMFD